MSYKKPELLIYQFADNQTYDSTLSLLSFYDPLEVKPMFSCSKNPLEFLFFLDRYLRYISGDSVVLDYSTRVSNV
jgi:hypothetical protein